MTFSSASLPQSPATSFTGQALALPYGDRGGRRGHPDGDEARAGANGRGRGGHRFLVDLLKLQTVDEVLGVVSQQCSRNQLASALGRLALIAPPGEAEEGYPSATCKPRSGAKAGVLLHLVGRHRACVRGSIRSTAAPLPVDSQNTRIAPSIAGPRSPRRTPDKPLRARCQNTSRSTCEAQKCSGR